MKQLLFLLLFPCLAMAQYPGNAGQKITLGEQTTADGLVWRGIRADTTSKIVPFSDTSAYIILDTVEKTLWLYKAGQIPKWQQVGGSTLDTATMLLPYWRSGRFSGVLPVANGGTGATTLAAAGINTGSGTANYLPKYTAATTFGNSLIYDNGSSVGIGTASPTAGFQLQVTGVNSRFAMFNSSGNTTNYSQMAFGNGGGTGQYAEFYRQNDTKRFQIFNDGGDLAFATRYSGGAYIYDIYLNTSGNVGIGTTSPAVQFHTTGGVRFAGLASITDLRTDADGDLFNGSDFNLKNSIDTINFGLLDVMKLKPVSFNWNDEARNINEYKSMGFIAQDVMNVIPNAASTMGDGDMQVDYNAIVATLTKAIQEQQALIKALEQRILNLENK